MRTHTGRRQSLTACGLSVLALTAACGHGTPATPSATRSPAASVAPASAGGPAPEGTAAGTQAPVPVESNPPGDIPDNVAFVHYQNAAGRYGFTYPEGWARSENGTAVTFTDKLNGIAADSTGAPTAPTVDSVRASQLPGLQQSQPAFELRSIEPVTLPAGAGVRLVYRRNSAPDPVTGRQVRDEVESYLVAGGGRSLRLDLFGPVGSDNVDAYRTISRSLVLG